MAKPRSPRPEILKHDADADLVLKINQNLHSLKSESDDKAKVNGRLLQQVNLPADVVDGLQRKLKAK
jgi:hypothetical protein